MFQAEKVYAMQAREGWAHDGPSFASVFTHTRTHAIMYTHTCTRTDALVRTRVREDDDHLWLSYNMMVKG